MAERSGGTLRKIEYGPNSGIDALFCLGHNKSIFIPDADVQNAPDHLSPISRLNTISSGILAEYGIVKTIVFSTGKTLGQSYPSEAEAMCNLWDARFPHLKHVRKILEIGSFSTDTNALECLGVSQNEGFSNTAILSNNIHVKNSLTVFRNAGHIIKPENCFSSEFVYAGYLRNTGRAAEAKEFLELMKYYTLLNGDYFLEKARKTTLLVDPNSKIANQITKVRTYDSLKKYFLDLLAI